LPVASIELSEEDLNRLEAIIPWEKITGARYCEAFMKDVDL
jgi:hypothetical protein